MKFYFQNVINENRSYPFPIHFISLNCVQHLTGRLRLLVSMDIGDSLVHAKDSFFNNIVSEINGNNLANVLPKIEDTNQTNEAVPNLSNAEWNELKTLFTSDATTEVNEFLLNEDNASEFLEYLKTGLPQPQQSSATLPSGNSHLFSDQKNMDLLKINV